MKSPRFAFWGQTLALALSGGILAAQAAPPIPSGITPPTPPSVTAPTVSSVSAPQLSGLPAPGPQSPANPSGSSAASTSLALSSLLGDSSNKLVSDLLGIDGSLASTGTLGSTAALGSTENLGSAEALGSSEALSSAEALLQRLAGILQSSGSTGDGGTTENASAVRAAAALAGASAKSGGAPSVKKAEAPPTTASSGAEILRFSIGAYDLTPTIGTVATSSIAPDGTFLLTGDRSYPVSGTSMRETFYFLCRPGPDGAYRLFADVAQSPENDRSACRRLARLGAVKGVAAGDQLLFRAADEEGPIYLLLRLFGPTVAADSDR